MSQPIERAYQANFSTAWPVAVRAGGLVFTSGFDGATSGSLDISAQCNAVYRAQQAAVAHFKVPLTNGVRLDHFTQSQSWLGERQTVRARFFGRPARITSTGVATALAPDNLLTAALICVADGAAKQVLIKGSDYGMPAIATLVRGGPLLFVSGILQGFRRDAGQDAATTLRISMAECAQTISDILQQADCEPSCILRQDMYVAEGMPKQALDDALTAHLPGSPGVTRELHMPFARPDAVEVTTLAAIETPRSLPGGLLAAGDFAFSPACAGNTLDEPLDGLLNQLATAGLELDRVVRLDVTVPRAADLHDARARCAARWPEAAPALVLHPGTPVCGGTAQVMGVMFTG